MRKRHPNPRLAKSLLTYDVAEIARLYGCHRGTVRNWLRSGLKAIDDSRPTLVRGDALNAFHQQRREAGKRPCGDGEIYCAPCGAPKRPSGGMVDACLVGTNLWRVTGLCPDCGLERDRLLRPVLAEVAAARVHLEPLQRTHDRVERKWLGARVVLELFW